MSQSATKMQNRNECYCNLAWLAVETLNRHTSGCSAILISWYDVMAAGEKQHAGSEVRIAIDIGSTVVKLARLVSGGELLGQVFSPRDFDAGIARQVESIVNRTGFSDEDVLICSSANGGLRVGIVCLTEHFSGATLRNQVLMAGANPVFVCGLDDHTGNPDYVDILIVGGGIDCAEAAPLEQRLRRFDASKYRFSALAYAGNRRSE